MRISELFKRKWSPSRARRVANKFHRLFYEDQESTWKSTYWLGYQLWKNPLDLWLYQEILYQVKPDVIIETGTAMGGSALYLASICDLQNHGRILTVDMWAAPYDDSRDLKKPRPEHPRIEYFIGSSTDPKIVETMKSRVKPGEKVLVILDSDHSQKHVFDELKVWSPMVTPGSYVIVEDSNINGHPVNRQHGPGPYEAINDFLALKPPFSIDDTKHKYHVTFNPNGYLKRH